MVLPSPEVETFLSALPGRTVRSAPAGRTSITDVPANVAADRSGSSTERALPFVTVTWAQTINGVVGTRDKRPVAISSPQSLELTHALRGRHETILVGIGTVLGDDPRLTTRLWDGPDPTPVVLDRSLRTPATAALFERNSDPPIIVYDHHYENDLEGSAVSDDTADAFRARKVDLHDRGARLMPGNPFDIPSVLVLLRTMGVASVMVEGGVRVLRSFLYGDWVNNVVITTAPQLIDGYSLNDGHMDPTRRIVFVDPVYAQFGPDLVVGGTVQWV